MPTITPLKSADRLREIITNAYRMDETECVNGLLSHATLDEATFSSIQNTAEKLVTGIRNNKKSENYIDSLLHQYDLSTDEGISLMCLAEALLRIPDTATMDKLISDKLSTANWKNHLDKHNSFFVNAATWSLLLTGKIYSPLLNEPETWINTLKRATSRLGGQMIRPFIVQMMKTMGNHFVLGQTIEAALKRAATLEQKGFRFSYDMLGEAARTKEDAERYYASYLSAIDAIGQAATEKDPVLNPGISVKLSALHPRYEFAKRERVLAELPPLLLALAQRAKHYQIGMTIDAEEADRLDLSLDIIEIVFSDTSLSGWNGMGLALQAYQKRAFFVIDWLAALAKNHQKQMMVRLVKGAYWDSEIKISQVQGFEDYPVFTRKHATDVSYLACAKKLFEYSEHLYLQFGTHNAYTVSAILALAKDQPNFEFQGLYGMGRALYDEIVGSPEYNKPCRIYAPVGIHQDLLAYLVRRLLENGTNTAFVNRLSDKDIPVQDIITNPVTYIAAQSSKPHPKIPKPKDIYQAWLNSTGIDLSNRRTFNSLAATLEKMAQEKITAHSIVNGVVLKNHTARPRYSPSNPDTLIGYASVTDEASIAKALDVAESAKLTWGCTSPEQRAAILEKAATLFEEAMSDLITLLSIEGGRCIADAISEVRETIDFCRYYAHRARLDLIVQTLPGPTGELNQLSMHPRGPIACISPWNFPLAIFTGQTVAALLAGNPVIAKPAEQTPLVAFKAVQILHLAGIPGDALQLLLGRGSVIGAQLTSDPRLAGVMFTGSTETAKRIELTLAQRNGPIGLLIAETGGQNVMIADSSVLPEQVVMDVMQSAFNSAGQRCSALRVLFVQEEIAPRILEGLRGAMAELKLGDPLQLSTDIGPVIDKAAHAMLEEDFTKMNREATFIARAPFAQTESGYYFAPAVFEIPRLSMLTGEVFGPILHVIRYASNELDQVIDSIIQSGYGLTLGIASRVTATIHYICKRAPVGNIYVNRNMIGAVVGVQPFGGERLSGTGPKAGGPHYLPRLCVERTVSTNTTAVGGNATLVSLQEE